MYKTVTSQSPGNNDSNFLETAEHLDVPPKASVAKEIEE
jgi:hypothetical protein